MGQPFITFQDVIFRYETAVTALFETLSLHFSAGWTGIVGANGAGKTTLLQLATGLVKPDKGRINTPALAVYCPQRTDEALQNFQNFLRSTTKIADIIKDQLEIGNDWGTRWPTLSHGERKRVQIGVALWMEPEALAIDEPTNHVDAEARALIAAALHHFRGVGLLVSHDRELPDSLCQQCVFVEPPGAIVRPGGITQGLQLAHNERMSNV